MIALPLYLFILIQLIVVSYLDIKYKKIRNIWVMFNITLSIIAYSFWRDLYVLSIDSFQISIAFIFVGFLLYMMKIMGGGDSKYLASLFLLIPLNFQEKVFLALLITTVVVGLIIFLKNIMVNMKGIINAIKESNITELKSYFGKKFAFAPVILLAWIWLGWDLLKK